MPMSKQEFTEKFNSLTPENRYAVACVIDELRKETTAGEAQIICTNKIDEYRAGVIDETFADSVIID